MKKSVKWLIVMLLIIVCSILIWRIAYECAKNPDNLPALSMIKEKGEAYANIKVLFDKKGKVSKVNLFIQEDEMSGTRE